MTLKKCDVCGGEIKDDSNYCVHCGVDLKDIEEKTPPTERVPVEKLFEASDEKKSNKEIPRFTPCQLKAVPFFHALFAYMLLFRGEALLTFCDCAVCNLSYREIYVYFVNIGEKRKLRPESKEIVRRVRDIDITAAQFDFSDIFGIFSKIKSTKEEKQVESKHKPTTTKNRKITIELDTSQLEEQIFHVIASERGKELIKRVLSE
ncbi:hypothetical protein [Methanocalculus sp.]|uniref:hypothetical protein n=1 Tax=Methanocalculus sp. TaxID=2004547 RepID=UPI002625BE24|nr:hypothetical protein [Methanocalculus sp.]MDG6249619.1 hypothetical protein [Methanocalculus sp.]